MHIFRQTEKGVLAIYLGFLYLGYYYASPPTNFIITLLQYST